MDALLERLATGYVLLVVVLALLPSRRYRALGAAGVALVGLAAAADAAAAPAPAGAFSNINELLALSGVVIVVAAVWLGWKRREGRPSEPAVSPSALPALAAFDLLLPAGLALIGLAPHLLLVALGALLALVWALRTALAARRPLSVALLVAGAASLGSALVLMLTILGPGGGSVGSLPDGPFSLAAERLLVLLFGLATLAFAGLPPLHRVPWGRGLAPLSALLLARVVVPALPDGLLTWQSPAMLLLTGALVWSALAARWAEVAVAGGLLALWSGASVPGCVLVAWGWLVEAGAGITARRGLTPDPRWSGLLVLPAALAALPALTAGLRAQVLLSVAAALGSAAGLFLHWKRGSPAVRSPLY